MAPKEIYIPFKLTKAYFHLISRPLARVPSSVTARFPKHPPPLEDTKIYPRLHDLVCPENDWKLNADSCGGYAIGGGGGVERTELPRKRNERFRQGHLEQR